MSIWSVSIGQLVVGGQGTETEERRMNKKKLTRLTLQPKGPLTQTHTKDGVSFVPTWTSKLTAGESRWPILAIWNWEFKHLYRRGKKEVNQTGPGYSRNYWAYMLWHSIQIPHPHINTSSPESVLEMCSAPSSILTALKSSKSLSSLSVPTAAIVRCWSLVPSSLSRPLQAEGRRTGVDFHHVWNC